MEDLVSSRELGPNLPKISVDVFYSPHGTALDITGLQERFEKADIYVPEMHGWSQVNLENYQMVSSGEKSPEEVLRELGESPDDRLYSLFQSELAMLYNSKKPVIFIDLPQEESKDLKLPIAGNNFQELLLWTRDFLERRSEYNIDREEFMLSQIVPQIKEVLEENTTLKEKPQLHILLLLGSTHTGIYHRLKERGITTTHKFSTQPVIYSHEDEAIRSLRFKKEMDDTLVARALLEIVFSSVFEEELEKITQDDNKLELLKRRLAGQFNLEEIKDALNLLPTHGWQWFKGAFSGYFPYLLEQKGIKLPESKEDLDQLLQTLKK